MARAMSRRLLIALAAALVLVIGGGIAVSPIIALNALRGAAERGDAAALERLVDFPAVRESLKAQLKTQLAARLREDPALKDNPLGAIALALAPAVTDGVVEAMVTPEAIAGLVREGDARRLDPAPAAAAPAPAPPATDAREPDVRYAYRGLNTFAAAYQPEEPGAAPVSLVLERRGVADWRLIRIELPPGLLAD
jgi:hypothetical protein